MLSINTLLLPVKGHYFLFFGGLAGVLPFLMTVMKQQFNASPAMIGIIYSTLPFFVMVAKPGFGTIADKFQQMKSVFIACLAIMTTAFFIIYFVPNVEVISETPFNVMCQNNSVSILACKLPQDSKLSAHNMTATCEIACPSLSPFTFTDSYTTGSCDWCTDRRNISDNEDVAYLNSSAFQGTISYLPSSDGSEVYNEDTCAVYPAVNLSVLNISTVTPFCSNVTYAICDINCTTNDAFSHSEIVKNVDQHSANETFRFTYQILLLWICMAIGYIGLGVATSIGDTITLNLLTNKGDFGRQRLWGALGWGSLSICTGKLIDLVSKGKKHLDFTPGFFITLVCGICNVLVASQIKVQKSEKPKKLLKNVWQLFKRPNVLVFCVSVFLIGYNTGTLWTFLILYLNDLGAEQFLIGLTLGVQCFLGEIPFFFFSNWFLKKIGHAHSMTLVLAIFGIRFLLYSFLYNPWLVLPIELTQGITYGIFFTALATYPSVIAPPNAQATIQGILQGIFEGFGVGVGNLIAGTLYEMIGGRHMFLLCGVVSLSCSLVVGLFNFIYVRRQTKNDSLNHTTNFPDAELKNETELLNVALEKEASVTENDELNHL